MKTQTYTVQGEETTTRFVETLDDFGQLLDWLHTAPAVLGLDTETTGLRMYSVGFACRLVQIGSPTEAWVVPVDRFSGRLLVLLEAEVASGRRFVAHNAAYDALVLDAVGIIDLDTLGPALIDTQILAHLLDPRPATQGGTGLGLKALAETFVDPTAPDTSKDLYEMFRKEYGATKASGEGWAKVDIDHPLYVLYAGLDVILVTRLLRALSQLIRGNQLSDLAAFEHRVMLAGARMQRRGLLLDVPYTEHLIEDLTAEQERQSALAAAFGVANVNSVVQVREALLGTGEDWNETTDSGALSVGGAVLRRMADLDKDWTRVNFREPNPLADAVLRSKRAGKWRESYAQTFLDVRDAGDRIHPSLNVLAARTARMSVSDPPLQQLPASGWRIRRAIVADPGQVLVSCDYSQVEMRVLGALGDVQGIKDAVLAGESIHVYTANLLWPEGYEKWQYKIAKNTGFCKVYGGGTAKVAETSGVDVATAKEVTDAYERAFPEIAAFGKQLQRQAQRSGGVIMNSMGRHLPLDRERAYAATNYVCQSEARDIMAAAILRMEDAGLGKHLLLPIHDEMLAQAPAGDAQEVSREIASAMETELRGVAIEADSDVYGWSWGHGYATDDEKESWGARP